MATDEEKIAEALAKLNENGKRLQREAIDQGHKNEVCGECGVVLLAQTHLLNCGSKTCPKIARHPDGRPKTLFDIWDEADARKAMTTASP